MGDECSEFLGLLSGFLCFLPKSSRNFWNLHGFHSAQFENQYPRANFPSQEKKLSSEVELFAPRTLVAASSTLAIRKERMGKYACIVALVSEDGPPSPAWSLPIWLPGVCKPRASASAARVTLHPWHLCGQLTSAISIGSTVDILCDIKEEM